MKNIFGTDGIRGRAGVLPMDAMGLASIGKAFGVWLRSCCTDTKDRPSVLIGKDTRNSGDMLSAALAAGLMDSGVDVMDGGILPTPAVALAVRSGKASAGAVISASHNPYYDNGVKFFTQRGMKLSDDDEEKISALFMKTWTEKNINIMGRMLPASDILQDYISFILTKAGEGHSLNGMKLVLDTAHGAMYQAAPEVFRALGAEVHVLAAEPDGMNINEGVGSQHTELLCRHVTEKKAHAGFAFDGDGDRLIAVDAYGKKISGDTLLAIFARSAMEKGQLNPPVLVSTVMSNLGLKESLEQAGIVHEVTGVGDRQVLQRMHEKGALIGGEDSGHLIFLGPHCTGDGLFAAVLLARLCKKKPLHELAACMRTYPQVLVNIPVKKKISLEKLPGVQREIEAAEKHLGNMGRILVRYSGTEPLCRIMVEAESEEEARAVCDKVQKAMEIDAGLYA
ncbi:phosphoglucosamine mutase [Desulfobotulus alkaliphilus]|uniref:Phosphoglucosamine mutase n=1 Tax=Desulfobotulus alkaliphilus TaxID=622671 RepID=A0A562RYW9_9BACT|nr:phosphoglucosamine mutase [Desulfobotulus alkaliphilus]TWI74329.1 phosphoglucosamine mutase [Desulfobotulus alkaliphilus]